MDVLIAKCIENKFLNFVFFPNGVENDKNKANASKKYFFCCFLKFLFSNFFLKGVKNCVMTLVSFLGDLLVVSDQVTYLLCEKYL